MASIFAVGDVPCGIFSPLDGMGIQATLSFVRAAARLTVSAPYQTPGGEVLQSYVAIGTYRGELEPDHGGLERTAAGQIIDIAYKFYVTGTPDLQEGDRTYIAGRQAEVVAPNQFGLDHLEAQMRWIGR